MMLDVFSRVVQKVPNSAGAICLARLLQRRVLFVLPSSALDSFKHDIFSLTLVLDLADLIFPSVAPNAFSIHSMVRPISRA